ncbi:MAG: creatininase family protein [Chloroflexota bacterium]
MLIENMNWMQVEQYLERDDKCVIPLGSTEQHAYLSLCVDKILAAKVAEDAAEPLGVPVYPVVPFGLAHQWTAYPGTVTVRVETYMALLRDVLDSVNRTGFRRMVIVNGHGGNTPAKAMISEWMMDNPACQVKWHDWWNAPQTWAKAQAIDPQASHASWLENFPWTRTADAAMPEIDKEMADIAKMAVLSPPAIREYLGDGNMGGAYQKSDADMQALWDVAIAETRALIETGWA